MKVGPSPAWLRDRLELVGIRSINNVVDLTNYVMIEMGQPTHSFDLGRVPGGKLVVRWSRPGEKLTTLDGVERTLPARVGVIAGQGGEPALALAGIMGGASSEIHEGTTAVALEAAWWEPLAVRRAARALGDAHRGLPPLRARGRRRGGPAGPRPPRAPAREDRRRARCGPGSSSAKGHERPARTVRLRAGAGERAARRRGAAAAAGAHARVARLPRHRLRPRGDRPRAVLAPRRLARGGPRRGGRPSLRAGPDRGGPAPGVAPGAARGPRSGASGASATS